MGKIFSSKSCNFQYDDRLLFSMEMGNIKTQGGTSAKTHEILIEDSIG